MTLGKGFSVFEFEHNKYYQTQQHMHTPCICGVNRYDVGYGGLLADDEAESQAWSRFQLFIQI